MFLARENQFFLMVCGASCSVRFSATSLRKMSGVGIQNQIHHVQITAWFPKWIEKNTMVGGDLLCPSILGVTKKTKPTKLSAF